MKKTKKPLPIAKIIALLSCVIFLPFLLIFILFFTLAAIQDLYGTDFPDSFYEIKKGSENIACKMTK